MSIDNLNEFSKFKKSISRMLLKINKLRKKNIKTRKDIFTLSLFIFLSENIIFVFVTTFGFTNLSISMKKPFIKIYILKNFIPDVVDKTDPPIKVKNRKYNPKLFGTVSILIPEFPTLLIIFISTDIKFKSLAK